MTRFLTGLSALALLSACELPPEGVDTVALTNFDGAVASIGCDLVTEADYIPVELQTGMTRAQVQQTVAFKLQQKQGVPLSNGGYRSKVGSCADATGAAAA